MKIGQNNAIPPVVKNLLLINIALYALSILFIFKFDIDLADYLGLHYFSNPNFKPWQLLTHMFMHASAFTDPITGNHHVIFTHILFNMFGLYMFGSFLENLMGGKRFLILYLVSGFGALIVHMGIDMFSIYQATGEVFIDEAQAMSGGIGAYFTTVIGASGALYGIMAAFAYLFPNTALYIMFIPVPLKAKFVIPGFIIIDIVSGVTHANDNIAHFAHIGGALFGFLLIYYWNKRNRSSFY